MWNFDPFLKKKILKIILWLIINS